MDYLLLNGMDTLNDIENGLSSVSNSTFSIYAIMTSISSILGLSVSVFMLIVGIIGGILGFVFGILEYILPAIALFKMAKKSGYKYPWMAFIPVAQTYLEFVLPRKEFNVLFKTKKRNMMGLITIILTYFGTTIILALNVVPALGQLLDILLPIVLIAFNWRRKYDMICTFKDKDLALPISILSIPFPLLYTIVLLVLMNKEPEYGAGNYYNVYMEDY